MVTRLSTAPATTQPHALTGGRPTHSITGRHKAPLVTVTAIRTLPGSRRLRASAFHSAWARALASPARKTARVTVQVS